MTVKRQTESYLRFLRSSYRRLINASPFRFSEIVPSNIPDTGGVYLITAKIGRHEQPYYVGRSQRLKRRIYTNHLMGPVANARLKRYLIASGECADVQSAKDFIKAHCSVRWIEEDDVRKRGAIEGYATGLLFPKYGIYIEH